MKKAKIAWKVYGPFGEVQRETFEESTYYDFSNDQDGTRIIEVINADRTGTHDYAIVVITRDSDGECFGELDGQLTDGIFENYGYGLVEEIPLKDTIKGIKRRDKIKDERW